MTALSILIILALLARAWSAVATRRQLKRIADALDRAHPPIQVEFEPRGLTGAMWGDWL